MFKKKIFCSLIAGSFIVLGHSYYKNKNLDNNYFYYYKDRIKLM